MAKYQNEPYNVYRAEKGAYMGKSSTMHLDSSTVRLDAKTKRWYLDHKTLH